MTLSDNTCKTAFGCFTADDSSVFNSETEVVPTAPQSAANRPALGNNNNSICVSSAYQPVAVLDKSDFSFPRRVPVDLEFQDVRYTVGQLSLKQRKYGKNDCPFRRELSESWN